MGLPLLKRILDLSEACSELYNIGVLDISYDKAQLSYKLFKDLVEELPDQVVIEFSFSKSDKFPFRANFTFGGIQYITLYNKNALDSFGPISRLIEKEGGTLHDNLLQGTKNR